MRHEILSVVGRKHKVERRNSETVRLGSDGMRSKVAYGRSIEQFCRNEVVAERLLGEFEERNEFVKKRNYLIPYYSFTSAYVGLRG